MNKYSFWQLLELYERKKQIFNETAERIAIFKMKDNTEDVIRLQELKQEIKEFERLDFFSEKDLHF